MERKEVEKCLEKIESALAGKVCDEREVCMILRTIHLYIIRLEKENNRLIETLATDVIKLMYCKEADDKSITTFKFEPAKRYDYRMIDLSMKLKAYKYITDKLYAESVGILEKLEKEWKQENDM